MTQHAVDESKSSLTDFLIRWSSHAGYYKTLSSYLHQLSGKAIAPIRRLGVTSCARRSGASTVTIQLAAAFCKSFGISVLLLDANLENPMFHKSFVAEDTPGLLNVLAGDLEVSDCIAPASVDNLSIMALGDPVWSKVDYGRDSMAGLFTSLSEHCDLVVVDLPTIGPGTHWQALSREMDGVVAVVAPHQTRTSTACRAKRLLDEAKVNLLGVVINRCTS